MSVYPGGLDSAPQTYTDFTGDPGSAPPTAVLEAADVNLLFSALVAIETALGLTPQGTVGTGSGAASVAARLTAIDQAIAAGGVADGSITTAKLAAAAVTAAKVAAGAIGTAALADGSVTAAKVASDVATQAELDAVITALGGKADTSALAAYLTTAAASGTYAPLASPALTGNPTAPTPTAGDNDTSVATTAFVTAATLVYTPERYGAKGDWRQVTDAAITSGAATLTSATAAFTAADVGKVVSVQGAGAAGIDLVTTISAFTNSTTVTLAANAGTTVTGKYLDIATDDTVAIQAAIDAAATAGGGVVQLAAKTYVVNAAPRTDRGARAILCPPQAAVRTTMTIRGVLPAEHHDTQSKPVTTIKTLRVSDTYVATHPPAVLAAQGQWNILLENLAIVVPKDPRICGVDFYDILRCEFRCVNLMPDWRGVEAVGSATQCWPYGIRTKGGANYDKILFTSVLVAGFWNGIVMSCEHVCGVDVVIHRCQLAIALEPATHAAVFQKLSVENCNVIFAAYDPTAASSGYGDLVSDNGTALGVYPIVVNLLDLEAAATIKDPHNKLRGIINFFTYSSTVRDNSYLNITGGAGLRVTNLMAIGNGKIVPSHSQFAPGVVDGIASGTTPPVVAAGGFNGCMTFDGSGSGALATVCCVNLGLPVAQNSSIWAPAGAQPFTVEARFKRTRSGVAEALVGMWSTAAGGGNYLLELTAGNKIQAVIRGNSGANFIATGTTSVTDTTIFHSAAMTFDGTSLRVFLDGVLEATVGSATSATSPLKNLPLLVGSQADGSAPFIGSVDEVRLSSVARYTAAYTPASVAFTPDGSTAGLWHLDTLL